MSSPHHSLPTSISFHSHRPRSPDQFITLISTLRTPPTSSISTPASFVPGTTSIPFSTSTFIGVLNVRRHADLVNEGWEFFKLMEKLYKIGPKIEHYGCMVNLLRRAGLVDEAYELVQSIRIKPNLVLWASLMAACRLRKKLELGEKIADVLVNNGLDNSETYILLSNMDAAVGIGRR